MQKQISISCRRAHEVVSRDNDMASCSQEEIILISSRAHEIDFLHVRCVGPLEPAKVYVNCEENSMSLPRLMLLRAHETVFSACFFATGSLHAR